MLAIDRTVDSHPSDSAVTSAQRMYQGIVSGHRLLFAVLDPTNLGIDMLLADAALAPSAQASIPT
jgi:hypothetical protein